MRRLLFLALAIFLLGNGVTYAADAAAVPNAKIGVVDMQTIAMESEPAVAFKAEMEKKYGKEREALKKQGEAVQKQAKGINPKSSEEKKVAFIKARQKLEQDTRNLMRKAEQDEVKFRQDMVSLVFSASYEVARAKGYNFVVDITAGGVLYADPSMDLTKDVLAQVNETYKKNKDKPDEAKNAEKSSQAPAEKK